MTEASSTAGSGRGTILIINGPNLNLLGTREPEKYGTSTLADVEQLAIQTAEAHGFTADCVQSNHEGDLLDAIHAARTSAVAIVINAGAFTHTSIALRDALAAVQLPAVEVHITNVHQREEFRHLSYLSPVCTAVIVGAGVQGYKLAIDYLAGAV
jgi:3-dehydroquinate dehydratase-2